MVKIKVIFSKDFEAHHSHPFFDVVATLAIWKLALKWLTTKMVTLKLFSELQFFHHDSRSLVEKIKTSRRNLETFRLLKRILKAGRKLRLTKWCIIAFATGSISPDAIFSRCKSSYGKMDNASEINLFKKVRKGESSSVHMLTFYFSRAGSNAEQS